MKILLTKTIVYSYILAKIHKSRSILMALAFIFVCYSFDIVYADVNINYVWSDKALVDKINLERSKGGLVVLKENDELNRLARERLKDLIENNYFSHTSPYKKSLDDILPASSYDYSVRGENLAYGEFDNEGDVTKSWMNSSGHKYNILYKNFREIGTASSVANYMGGKYVVIVQVFGAQKVQAVKNKTDRKLAVASSKSLTKISDSSSKPADLLKLKAI